MIVLVTKRPDHLNVSIKPELKDEWDKYAGRLGIKFSTWISVKMEEFIEEQTELEELRKNKR